MSDRELLELAAKAAGYDIQGTTERMICQPDKPGGFCILNERGGTSEWNPLTDDGDALRLAVKLGTSIKFCVLTKHISVEDCCQPIKDDPYAATRRAIVRAAAGEVA